jgi:hypothetical protein
MVGVLVDHYLIASPIPATDDVVIVRGNVPVEIVKPEALPVSPGKDKYMFPSKATGEASVRPCTIYAVMRILGSTTMSNPVIVPGVHVRKFRMASPVHGNAILSSGLLTSSRVGIARRPGTHCLSRAVSWDVSAANVGAMTAAALLPTAPPILRERTHANQH